MIPAKISFRSLLAVCVLVSAILLPSAGIPAALPITILQVGPKALKVELARTQEQREAGLMHRRELGEDEGMLFLYDRPQQMMMYMKDTHIPLSVAFIDSAGVILEIRDMAPLDETPVLSVSRKIRFALEANRGWFAKNGIAPGATVKAGKSDLLSLF
ncbi:MAG: DUF192 domain-containing protein [Candidatus Omnitrophica bacterium]|nr:DUF192 domain-containing protein [Candidatus Omnitrophota bacterium]